ncbi:hypothetical protein [uncultured Ezakiella sp.]|uniref:hypothetical protein n=1 Tax=uncultured Ezakiella sp. TaxID=1637529 RepID=UPI0025DEA38F|nr:hypothetical protein [uncultured Ezakiella sp.]
MRKIRKNIPLSIAEEKNEQSRLIEFEEFLENQELKIKRYDEDLIRKLIEKTIVYDESL